MKKKKEGAFGTRQEISCLISDMRAEHLIFTCRNDEIEHDHTVSKDEIEPTEQTIS